MGVLRPRVMGRKHFALALGQGHETVTGVDAGKIRVDHGLDCSSPALKIRIIAMRLAEATLNE